MTNRLAMWICIIFAIVTILGVPIGRYYCHDVPTELRYKISWTKGPKDKETIGKVSSNPVALFDGSGKFELEVVVGPATFKTTTSRPDLYPLSSVVIVTPKLISLGNDSDTYIDTNYVNISPLSRQEE